MHLLLDALFNFVQCLCVVIYPGLSDIYEPICNFLTEHFFTIDINLRVRW